MKFKVSQTGRQFKFNLTLDSGVILVVSKDFPNQEACINAIRELIV